jgi:hypothetical protein
MDSGVHEQERQDEPSRAHLVDSVHEHSWTPDHGRAWTSTDALVEVLREQLQMAQERERRYDARERAYQEHIAQLTTMLDQAHQQNQRLLAAPRPEPVSPRTSPPAPSSLPAGAMRQQILTLLRDAPEGLTPAEMRTLLGADKSLSDTCSGMLRDGLLRRVGRGRYVGA